MFDPGFDSGTGLFGRLTDKLIKFLQVVTLCSALSFAPSGQAIDLISPETCSSGITNMMTDMGLMAYQLADFMNSFCQAIPFFGSFCPDLDQMAGAFFSSILANPDLTLDMMVCADNNPSMLSFMLHVMSENPELLDQLSGYLGQTGDGTSKGCQLGEVMTAMALHHDDLSSYLFANMNSYMYANLAKNMQCQTDTTVQLSELIADNSDQLKANTPFDRVMRKLGTVDSDTDGNEVSNERMFRAIFNNIDAANYFLDALDQLDDDSKTRVLDFVFLGITTVTDPNCNPNYSTCSTSEQIHGDQVYLDMYGMLDGFNSGVMSQYVVDPAYPPTPDSEIPANALFGRMAPLLMTPSYEISGYGMSFFGALLTGANVYQWQPAQETLGVLGGIMELGQLPFTFDDLEPYLPYLVNQDAPAPRNILTLDDCAADLAACLTPIDCNEMGGYWYDDMCNAQQQIQTAHLEGSLFYSERKDIGPFVVDNDGDFTVVLSGTGDVDMYVKRNNRASDYSYDCKSDNPATSEESCVLYGEGEYWISLYGDWDMETTYVLDASNNPNINGVPDGTVYSGTGCAIDLSTCYLPQLCDDAGGYWYDDTCNAIPPVQTASYSEQLDPGESRDYGGFDVENAGNFLAELSGNGDFDLYVRRAPAGSTTYLPASPDENDCASETSGSSTESCELLGEGVYWVHVVNNGSASASFDLNVKNNPSYVPVNGNVALWEVRVSESGDGRYIIELFGDAFNDADITEMNVDTDSRYLDWGYRQYYGPYSPTMGDFTAALSGDGDVDLYVDDQQYPVPQASWNLCNSDSSDSSELCEIADPGQYWITVDAYKASNYTIKVDYPRPSERIEVLSNNHAFILTSKIPAGEIRIKDINGRSASLPIPDVIEPIDFNDNDDDGLNNVLEEYFGTDPDVADTDGDGISDLDEVSVDGDITTYTEGVDTDPTFNDFDTDGDGINNDVDPLPESYNYSDGDLAPLGAPDGVINVADYLIALRIIAGEVTTGDIQLMHGDVYPPDTPDGTINIQDLLLIQKQVMAQ